MKKEKNNIFISTADIDNILTEPDKELYQDFIRELKLHVKMSKLQSALLINDFNAGIMYYHNNGLSFEEAARRLDPRRLGGFYSAPANYWYPLDNAAIIYPLSMKHGVMPMFRLGVYLKEDVIPEILQLALDFTIKRFPSFGTTIKKGFFWHYLDDTKRRFTVEEEKIIPLRPIKVATTGSQSFRVMYFGKRISVEYFHVLTDGTGGMIFLKTLTAEYLRLLGHPITPSDGVWDIEEAPSQSEVSNEFAKTERQEGVQGFMGHIAAQISGRATSLKPCQVLHLEMDAEKLRNRAHEYGVSLTSYLVANMLVAGKYACQDTNGEFRIQVPVNMRKYNGSNTVRNYSMYFSADLPLSQITNVADIVDDVAEQIKFKSSKEEMTKMMSTTVKLVQSLKYVPLAIKKPVVEIVYGFLGDRIFSSYLSNLGVIKLPAEMEPFVDRFDFLLSPSEVCRASCALVTYNNKAIFSITKITSVPSFEERLVKLLEDDGLTVEVSGSPLYES